jgi:hypothetical protein
MRRIDPIFLCSSCGRCQWIEGERITVSVVGLVILVTVVALVVMWFAADYGYQFRQ